MRTLYRGGLVHTPRPPGSRPDAAPTATALLVDGDTLAWVGRTEDAPAGADTVVDLDGALVTPAFVDAHVHVTETALAATGVDLSRARDVATVLDLVAAAARTAPGPVSGHGWDERGLEEGRAPTRHELDRAAGDRPVYLSRIDVHSAVVSTALARAAGADTLPGWQDSGRVERDAHHAVRRAMRSGIGAGPRRDLQRHALRTMTAAGIAAVHEMSAPDIAPDDDLRLLVELAATEGGLPDVVPYRGVLVDSARAAREVCADLGVPLAGLAGDLCVDGSIGSRTAAFREPYADAPDTRGNTYLDADLIAAHVVACTEVGLQAGFHVIGDAAVDAVLAGCESAAGRLGAERIRAAGHRLEHVECLDQAAIEALGRLGITASVQPAFDACWGGPAGMYAARLGKRRAARLNPFADLLAAGVALAAGSDAPVTPADPWAAVRALTSHSRPSQRLDAVTALDACTRGGWRAGRRPEAGVLRAGAEATFAVWRTGDDTDAAASGPAPGASAGGVLAAITNACAPGAAPVCLRTVKRGELLHDVLDGCELPVSRRPPR